jgi:hypothetical protein
MGKSLSGVASGVTDDRQPVRGEVLRALGRALLGLALLAISAASGCATRQPTVGDIYSVANSNGSFGVIRVLATRERDFYIRIYGDRFDDRPGDVVVGQLSLEPYGGDGFVLVPIVTKYFRNTNPRLIKNVGPPSGEDLRFAQEWARDAAPPPDGP